MAVDLWGPVDYGRGLFCLIRLGSGNSGGSVNTMEYISCTFSHSSAVFVVLQGALSLPGERVPFPGGSVLNAKVQYKCQEARFPRRTLHCKDVLHDLHHAAVVLMFHSSG